MNPDATIEVSKESKLRFAPDTDVALVFMVALVNTRSSGTKSGGDDLDSAATLTALLDTFGYTRRFDRRCATRTRSPDSSDMTATTGTCMRRPPRRLSPNASGSRSRSLSSMCSASTNWAVSGSVMRSTRERSVGSENR